MTRSGSRTKALGLLLVCLGLPAYAAAQGVGAIGGTVQDSTGGALPGVTVSLSNPGIIGGSQQTVTDERGDYRFARLVPAATYTVQAELPGFGATGRSAIVVNADFTTRVDLVLQPGGVAETVTVSGASPLVDTTAVLKQTVLETETLGRLPTGRDLWTAVRTVPGAVVASISGGGGYDVGGTGSLLQSVATVHGSQVAENRYYVDGQDVTAINSPGLANSYFDTSMFQEVNVQTGNAPAESQMGGVVYNMVTKTGTNVLRGSLFYTGTHHALQADNVTSRLRQQLLAGVPARALQANPDLEPSARILTFYNVEANVSGPVLRDRLWFTTSTNRKPLDQYRLGSYNPDGTQFVDDNLQWNYGFKLSWQASANNQVHYTNQTSHRTAFHRVTDGTAFWESRSAGLQTLGFTLNTVRWTSVLSNRLVLEVSGGNYYGLTPILPQPEVQPGDVPQWDSATNTYRVAMGTYTRTNPGTVNLNASLSYVAGNHDLKIGYQPNHQWNRIYAWSTSNYPSGLLAIVRNGTPDSVRTYNTPLTTETFSLDHGIFIQDKWRASRRLTLNLGLRLQQTNGWVQAQCQAQTVFVPQEQCFAKIEDVPDWFDLTPRVGLVYDVAGNGRTAVKFAANRYTVSEGPLHAARVNPLRVVNDTRPWSDGNADGVPQLTELGASTGFALGSTTRYQAGLDRPYTNEMNVAVEQQLPFNMAAAVGYFFRQTKRNLGSRNLAVPAGSYTPLTVVERSSGREVTVYDQALSTRGLFDIVIDNAPELDAQFHGVDLTVTKRLSDGWMVLGGLALGKNVGNTYTAAADLNNPNFTFVRGRVSADVPLSLKLAVLYDLPYGVSFGANAQHYSGFPESDTVVVSRDTAVLTQVSQSIRVAPQGTNRLPGVTLIDLSVRRRFRVLDRVAAEPVIEIFNLANANTVTSRSTLLGPVYHRVNGILPGRLVRFGFDVKF